MNDWSIDYVNEYLLSTHHGKLACELTPAKGRILSSKQHFKQGDVILEESPLHVVAEETGNEAFRTVRSLCKKHATSFEHEPLWYWAALCSLTEEQACPGPTKGSFHSVNPDTQRKLLCLYHDPVAEPSCAAKMLVQVFRLSVAPIVLEELIQAWILNCFDHSDEPQGYAAYFGASFMSHSCLPNAIWHFAEGTSAEDTFVLRARQDIAPADEICISYLPEEGLLKSALVRKKELQSTKRFLCTCQRCGPGGIDVDRCRGFRCPHCGLGTVFHPAPLRGNSLSGAACPSCGKAVGHFEKRLLEAESWLSKRVKLLGNRCNKTGINHVLKEPEAQQLLRVVGDSETGSIGPQHWLCDTVWALLADWYEQTGREEDARRMMRLRVAYQRDAYVGLNGQLGWTLEAQAGMLLQHLGLEPGHRSPHDLDEESVKCIAAQALPMFDEAVRILRTMFGDRHEYFRSADNKRRRLCDLLNGEKLPPLLRKRRNSKGVAVAPAVATKRCRGVVMAENES